MIRIPISLLFLIVFASAPSAAQKWSAEQQEVWEFQLTCLRLVGDTDAVERFVDCFHDDFVGWRTGDSAPRDKNSVRTVVAMESWGTRRFLTAWPMSIKLYGDVAVVHNFSQWSELDSDGKRVIVWARWTDIAMKSGGRWQWIADAGG